jgi:hypothetical protein
VGALSPNVERRIDNSQEFGDGAAYTYNEFMDFYGGGSFAQQQWELAGGPEARAAREACEARRQRNEYSDDEGPQSNEPSPDQLVMAVMGAAPLTESDFEETVVSRSFLQMASDLGFFNELMADIVEFGLAVETSASTYADYVDECVEDDLDPEMGDPRRKRRLTEAEFNAMFKPQ